MPRLRLVALALCATTLGWPVAPRHAEAAPTAPAKPGSEVCEGTVFDDLDLDGAFGQSDAGVADVEVRIVDRSGRSATTRTDGDGRWSTDVPAERYPVRLEFVTPDGYLPAGSGEHNGTDIQFVQRPGDCDGASTGGYAVFVPGAACTEGAALVTGCYLAADSPGYDDATAVAVVDLTSVDSGAVDGDSVDDWLSPGPTGLAGSRELGTVYGLATDWRGNVYAGSFVKRHTRLRSRLNPRGNPTTIYRLAPGREPEVLVTVDPEATDPHDADERSRDGVDAFDDVYRSGLGDLEVSTDGTRLYTVDLGSRELVSVALPTGRIVDRWPLTGAALGIDGCAVSPDRPFGDLRGFGLGFTTGGNLLVGVVCSAESTVPSGAMIDDVADAQALGDPGQLAGHVVELVGDDLEVRLSWTLDHDRGVTQDNGKLSNRATWHPWIDAVPFGEVDQVVSYPQPAITDLTVDGDGNLLIGLGDRWGHQTVASSEAPTVDGGTVEIDESVIAGDLQRACPRGDRWTIEGRDGCGGGWGNGFEWFDGDSYGWHAETTLGSVLALPTDGDDDRDIVVASQMDPLVGRPDPWRSGGLAWHDARTGAYLRGVRLYDGRHADPEFTFEKSSGIADLALLCDAADLQLGGRAWRDVDADGEQDPAEPSIDGLRLELRAADGSIVATTPTDDDGRYEFDSSDVDGGLDDGGDYLVTVADWNFAAGPLGRTGAHTGLRPTLGAGNGDARLDSDARVAGPDSAVAGMTVATAIAGDDPSTGPIEAPADHSLDLGFQEQFDLAIATRWIRHDDVLGVLAFEIMIHNQGSQPSGAFALTDLLPYGTTLIAASEGGIETAPGSNALAWSFDAEEGLVPGETRRLDVLVHVEDVTLSPFVNAVQLTDYSDTDDDSVPGNSRLDEIIDRPNPFPADGGIFDDNGGWREEDDADIAAVQLHQVGGRLFGDRDRDGRFEPADPDVAGGDHEQPIAGVGVVLRHADGTEIERQWTSHDGTYRFSMVPSDQYVVELTVDEFSPDRPLASFDWLSSSRRVGPIDRADGVTIPITLRPDDDEAAVVDVGLGNRPGRAWFGWFRGQMVAPGLVLAALAVLLVQRRTNRLATLT
jgi:hypothetical protein